MNIFVFIHDGVKESMLRGNKMILPGVIFLKTCSIKNIICCLQDALYHAYFAESLLQDLYHPLQEQQTTDA